MKRIINKNKGFIKTIVLIIIALVLLKYFFDISVNDILTSQVVKDIWAIIKSLFQTLWNLVLVVIDFLKALLANAKQSLVQ